MPELNPQSTPISQISLAPDGSGLAPGIPMSLAGNRLELPQQVLLQQAALVSGASVPPAPAGNPLSMISNFAEVQGQLNQNKLFAQTYAARQKAGQIMSTAPDVETGIQQMLADPQVAPFAGETISAMRQAQQTLIATQGEQQKQASTGLEALLKSLPAVMADPEQWDGVVKANLATLSPSARAAVVPAVDSIKHALLDDLPSDPGQRRTLFNQRLSGMMLGAGITPEQIQGIVGKPSVVNTGGSNVFGVQLPGQLGGGFSPSGRPVANTLAPTVVKGTGPEGEDVTTVWGGGGGGSGNGGVVVPRPSNGPSAQNGNALSPPIPPTARTPSNALIGPSQTQTTYNQDRTKDIADYEKNLDDRVNNGSQLRKNVGEVVGAMHDATTGGGAETYAKLGSALQAIGVKNPTVDKWANGSLAASQVIDKVALQDSMSQLKQQLTGVGGSRLNAQEFVAYLNKNPNLVTDPRAAVQVFNLWQQFYDRDKTEQAMFDKFKSGNATGDQALDHAASNGSDPLLGKPDLKRWPALWNQSDYMQKFAPGGEISSAGVKGVDHPKDISDLMKKYGH